MEDAARRAGDHPGAPGNEGRQRRGAAMIARASLRYYKATNAMVVLGVAVAVAVLAGALLVGASVRESLRQIALGRLGATEVGVTAPTFFRAALADDLTTPGAPLIAFGGAVAHDESKRSAGRVFVYGIDDRFGRFHGVEGQIGRAHV